ncbi:MAG: NAD(P)/FAD-dependent oxidoreductase, partial [Terriglobales bacterium]
MPEIVVVGGGLIGLALARELHRRRLQVSVWEAGVAGRGASWAGAGMLAAYQTTRLELRPLAIAGAKLYPSWVAELERETGARVGYRPSGSLILGAAAPAIVPAGWERLSLEQCAAAEPQLQLDPQFWGLEPIWRVAGDHSVDNRALTAALLASLRARGVPVHEETRVEAVRRHGQGLELVAGGRIHSAAVVVNAGGAWSAKFAAPAPAPVRPRKGQMLALASPVEIHHVIEAPGVYLVPRAGNKVLVGATLEDNGFDLELSAPQLELLLRRAQALVPGLAGAEVIERWAGLRPCSPDELPMIGETTCPGYWLATAHFRDGILLAPITAKIVADGIVRGRLTRA